MSLHEKEMLILLGGIWHDFKGFTSAMQNLFEGQFKITATYDLDVLTKLDVSKPDILLSYTSLVPARHQPGQFDGSFHTFGAGVGKKGHRRFVHGGNLVHFLAQPDL